MSAHKKPLEVVCHDQVTGNVVVRQTVDGDSDNVAAGTIRLTFPVRGDNKVAKLVLTPAQFLQMAGEGFSQVGIGYMLDAIEGDPEVFEKLEDLVESFAAGRDVRSRRRRN